MPARHPSLGSAELHVANIRGASTVVQSRARSPICLLTPRRNGPSVWAYTSSLGGGMVAGDEISLAIEVDAGARCFLGTQSSTKIYRNPEKRRCTQVLSAKVGTESLLVLAPDPVQCFADSIYEQRQIFHMAKDANLVLLDWFSAGRLARGERWQFERYASRNEIQRGAEVQLLDALELDRDAVGNKFCSGRFNCVATLIFTGPLLREAAANALGRSFEAHKPGVTLIASASPIADGAIVRLAGCGVGEVAAMLAELLSPVIPLLQDNPWARKW